MTTTDQDKAIREIAERHWEWQDGESIDYIGIDDLINALREAYEAGAKAQREQDTQVILAMSGKIAEAIRRGRAE